MSLKKIPEPNITLLFKRWEQFVLRDVLTSCEVLQAKFNLIYREIKKSENINSLLKSY